MIKSKITVINTGGTFNKVYNPLNGELEVSKDGKALEEISNFCPNITLEIKNIISKDSLEISDDDRKLIIETIKKSQSNSIIVVHGTDTMDLSAAFVDEYIKDKIIIFVGSMLPMSINKIEATLNFSQAIGFLNAKVENGVYISMHGSIRNHKFLKKDRQIGQFLNS